MAKQTDPSPPIPYPRASELVATHAATIASPSGQEEVPLSSALGRVLAETVSADRDQPPFDRSTRDGFAVRSADLSSGAELAVVGTLRAGEAWPPDAPPLAAGQAIRIMTGAPLPPGADAVVMLEHVSETLAGEAMRGTQVQILAGRSLAAGDNLVAAGAEARKGAALMEPGTRLQAAHIGLAAATGRDRLTVYPRPRVSILATGDELVEPPARGPEAAIRPEQIYNSNSSSLAAQVEEAGARSHAFPAARDTHASIRESILAAFAAQVDSGLLILSGGVSMGKYDLVEEVLAELGAEFLFTSVRIQPGKPVVFGRLPRIGPDGGDRYFFGLPGNPVSTMVTFSLFVRPLLAALCGETGYRHPFVTARLSEQMQAVPGWTRFLPAWIHYDIAEPRVTPIAWQGSGDLAAIARANCYVVAPPEAAALRQGDSIQVLLKPLS